jgi:hypothetical protein
MKIQTEKFIPIFYAVSENIIMFIGKIFPRLQTNDKKATERKKLYFPHLPHYMYTGELLYAISNLICNFNRFNLGAHFE